MLPTTFAEASAFAEVAADKTVVRMWKCCQLPMPISNWGIGIPDLIPAEKTWYNIRRKCGENAICPPFYAL